MAVTDDFSSSSLDLNGQVTLGQPTALVWGKDGRLYVTENGGTVNVLTIAFGDKDPTDDDPTVGFYVVEAVELSISSIQNYNDDGSPNGSSNRQVTGIDVVNQYDENGDPLYVQADGSISTNVTDVPAQTMYVTSSDSRVGAGGSGADENLDTNSGVITMFVQTSANTWDQIDIVRGLPRSEENHATNGVDMFQEIDPETGKLISERLIVASGGNANTGAPSNNFAGQQEQPLSAAILEVDITGVKAIIEASGAQTDPLSGRAYVVDLETLDDPTRAGADDATGSGVDPFGGNDGLNSAKLDYDGLVTIYSPGYRNSYDVLITEDGRVWTYDNGANNTWGGRPVGENSPGAGTTDPDQLPNYIATNLNNGDGSANDDINYDPNWNPSNNDNFHEVTRSDDLDGRSLSAGAFGTAVTYVGPDGETYVYGGHPNPTRAEGALAGLLYSPGAGTDNSFLLVSDEDTYATGAGSDYDQVIAYLDSIGQSTETVLKVKPGIEYEVYTVPGGYTDADGDVKIGFVREVGSSDPFPVPAGQFQGPLKDAFTNQVKTTGLPADIAEIVDFLNPVEGNYLEGGRADGALDSAKGSINGLAEYTSTILDDADTTMSGAILATSFNGGVIIAMGRSDDGTVSSVQVGSDSQAADRTTIGAAGGPLGIDTIGDDYADMNLTKAFQGSIWTAVYKGNDQGGFSVFIEVLQPGSAPSEEGPGNPVLGANLYAGAEIIDETDADLDGLSELVDPFEFDPLNGFELTAGETITLDFNPQNDDPEFDGTLGGNTGLLGAALDGPNSLAGPLASAAETGANPTADIQEAGATPNQDAQTGTYLENAGDLIGAAQQFDGLFDLAGNIIPGGNAPILQIKEVVPGTMVGVANTARDAVHTGVRPTADVGRLETTLTVKNWVASEGGVAPGQLTGLIYGDGTQSNFLRFVFGEVDGVPGIEIGYELGDANYTTVATLPLPALLDAANDEIDLRLSINIDDGFEVVASYRLGSVSDADPNFIDAQPFTTVSLNGGAGFSLPAGVLQDVLTGDHTITDNGTTLVSGAAIGVVAETTDGNPLQAIDFPNLEIRGVGNEIDATNAAEAGQAGTTGVDTVIYTGTDETLALAADVENFDGSGSSANFNLTANDLDNEIILGAGQNTVTTGAGDDKIIGTSANTDGLDVTDFEFGDKVVLTDATAADAAAATFGAGSAIITVNGVQVTFSGPDFHGFDPANGPATFQFEETSEGLEITLVPAETILYRVNAGAGGGSTAVNTGPGAGTIAAIDGGPDWVSDVDFFNGTGPITITGANGTPFTNEITDAEDEVEYDNVDPTIVPWQVFVNERSENTAAAPAMDYNFDVEAGSTYRIEVFYTENWQNIFGFAAGDPDASRTFDILVDGVLYDEFDDLNPLKEAVEFQAVNNPTAALPSANSAATSQKQPFNGVARRAELIYTAVDDELNLSWIHGLQNPKVNAIQITQLGGVVTPPADETAPTIESISFENAQGDTDSPRSLTVVLSDNVGFDPIALAASIDGSELSFSGDVQPGPLAAIDVATSDGDTTATITYTFEQPSGGWTIGFGAVDIAAGAYADVNGNTTAADSAATVVQPFLNNLVKGEVALAINVGPTTNTIDATLEGDDKNTYGGAIVDDPILGIDLQADDPAYYSPSSKTGSNIDGKAGTTGSNSNGVDLDGSALHTYRDSANGSFTAQYPVENGVYVVELWFAELFHATGGNRQGDYTINGEIAQENFDAFNAAGAADTPAGPITKTVVVTDGFITVDVNADTGQPGYNAIVIYDAIPADTRPTISVSDVSVNEGETATVVFSRIGDLSEDVVVTFTVAGDTADGDDFTPPVVNQVTILANETTAEIEVPITDDDVEEGPETISVTIDSVSNNSGDAVVSGTGAAAITIAASDASTQAPAGGVILSLDFETPDDDLIDLSGLLDTTVFDDALGGAGALETGKKTAIEDGKLVIETSNGDLSQTDPTASKNDLVRTIDLSNPVLEEIFITTQFDNPFDAAFLAENGITDGVVPNFAQQGVVIAIPDSSINQNAQQFVKLIFGGNSGNATQIWFQGPNGSAQTPQVSAMSDAAVADGAAAFGLADIARVELSLVVNTVDGTLGQYTTFFDDSGAVLGGVRPVATDGFLVLAPIPAPQAVLDAIAAGPVVVGVTSTDFSSGDADAIGAFEATWDFLQVSSPQFIPPRSDDDQGPTATVSLEAPATSTDPIVATVVYADLTGVDSATIDLDDITLTGGVFSVDLAPSSASFDAGTNTATYTFDAPVGGWENATYTATVAGGEVLDTVTPTANANAGGETGGLRLTFDTLVSVSGPGEVVEDGDGPDQTLAFDLAVSDPSFTGVLAVEIEVDGVATVENLAFVDGAATFEVSVPTDARWNGSESVSVELLSVETEGFSVNPAAASATATVTEDDPADSHDKGGAGGADPVVVGDFSDDRLAPTDIGALADGDNVIFATQQGDGQPGERDRDFITFTVPEGKELVALFLDGYVTTEDTAQAFLAIQNGAQVTVDPVTGAPDDAENPEGPFAGLVYGGGDVTTDLLPVLLAGGVVQDGVGFPGFPGGKLGAGTYTLWMNQGGPQTKVTLRAVLEAVPGGVVTAEDDSFNLPEDAIAVPLAVLINDSDSADGTLSVLSATDPDHGTAQVIDGVLYYTPDADYVGSDSFTYTATNGVDSGTATVSLNVVRSHEQPQSTAHPQNPYPNDYVNADEIAPEISPSGKQLILTKVADIPNEANGAAPRMNSFDTVGDRIFISTEGTQTNSSVIYELVDDGAGGKTAVVFFDVGQAYADGAADGRDLPNSGGAIVQQGLRGIAFHPEFETNGKLYTSITEERPADPSTHPYLSDVDVAALSYDSVVIEWTVDPVTGQIDPDSYREVFRIGNVAQGFNHPIRQIEFNPYAEPGDADYGNLYIATGDGTWNYLTQGRNASQNDDGLGKILRVDPLEQTDGSSYGIPADNPFVGDPSMNDAVYALGFRNPGTITFAQNAEGETVIITTSVGFDNFEEINIIEPGGNYGWPFRAGPFLITQEGGNTTGVLPLPANEADFDLVYPAAFIAHDPFDGGNDIGFEGDIGAALTGGVVISNGSELDGEFIFADFAENGRFFHVSLEDLLAAKTSLEPGEDPDALTFATPSELTLLVDHDGDPETTPIVIANYKELVDSFRTDVRFGEGPNGELYVLNKRNGEVYVASNTLEADVVNDAPLGVVIAPIVTSLEEIADTSAAIKIANITVIDDALGENALSIGGADADLFEIVDGGLFLKAGAVLDAIANPSLDVVVFVDDATVGGSPDASAAFALEITPETSGDPADVDGDGILNGADPAAFDASTGLGTVLESGQTIALEFDTDTTNPLDGTSGLTGVLVVPGGGSFGPYDAEGDPYGALTTETATIADGALIVPTTTGDIGGSNNGQDNFQTMVDVSSQQSVTFATKFANPFDAATEPFSLIGLTLGAGTQNDHYKVLFIVFPTGVAIQVAQENSASGGLGNTQVADLLDAGFGLADIADVEIAVTYDRASNTFSPVVTFLDGSGASIGGGSLGVSTATGSLLQALNGTNPATGGAGGVAVGLDASHILASSGFDAEFDYLRVISNDVPVGDPTVSISGASNIVEGDEGTTSATYTVTLSAPPTEPVDVTVDLAAVLGGGATEPATLPGDVSFAGGALSQTLTFTPDGPLSQTVTVEVAGDADVEANETFSISLVTDLESTSAGADQIVVTIDNDDAENQAPTAVAITPVLTEIAENADVAAPIKVADIVVTDDGLGVNDLSLVGDDAALFEIVGAELFLKAGVALDFAANAQLDVTVAVDDASVGATPDVTAAFSIVVTDPFTPSDIDGDGVSNIDDPFAYDGQNGLGRVLGLGGEFRQDFDTPTEDPFSAEGGFTGILANPGLPDPATPDENDPYNGRVNDDLVTIADGALKITSTETDAFNVGGTGTNNQVNDSYQSAVDVSGVTSYEVSARVFSDELPVTFGSTTGFEQYGVTTGAGGVDDFVKFVISDANNGAPRLQISHNQSLVGANDTNYGIGTSGQPIAIDPALIFSVEFKLVVDKTPVLDTDGVTVLSSSGSVVGFAEFFASDGTSLGTFETEQKLILAGSAFDLALDGENPLTGGVGGVGYGVFVTDWGGSPATANQITAEYDYLAIRSLDTTELSIADAAVAEGGDAGEDLLAFALSAPGFSGDLDVVFTVNGGEALSQTVTFADGAGVLSLALAQDDLTNDNDVLVALVSTGSDVVTISDTAASAIGSAAEDDFAPVGVLDTASGLVNKDITIDVVANDTDADDATETLSVSSFTQGANGSVALVDGALVYTPNVDFTGADVFTYVATDPAGNLSAETTVEVTVDPLPIFELSVADAATLEGGDLGADTLVFALSAPGFSGEAEIVYTVAGGDPQQAAVAFLDGAGFISVDAAQDDLADGDDGPAVAIVSAAATDVEFSIVDGDGASTITEDDFAPVGVQDDAFGLIDRPVTIDVIANDADADDAAETLSVASFTQGANGSVAPGPDGTLVYTPNAGFEGTDSFTYFARDPGGNLSGATTVNVTIDPLPTVGLTVGDATTTESGDVGTDTLIFVLVAPGYDGPAAITYAVDGGEEQTADVTFVSGAAALPVDVAQDDLANGDAGPTLVVTGAAGADVTFSIVDGEGVSTVAEDDFAPVPSDDDAKGLPNRDLVIDVLANDADADDAVEALQIATITQGENGTVSINLDGDIVYTPNPDFEGTDAFTYTAVDPAGNESAPATVNVAIEALPIVTLGVSDAPGVVEGGDAGLDQLAFPLTASVYDGDVVVDYLLDGVSGSATATFVGGVATLSIGRPQDDVADGQDAVVLEITGASPVAGDVAFDLSPATAASTVDEDDSAPTAVADAGVGTTNQPIVIDVLVNDIDADSPKANLFVASFTQGANGVVTENASGALLYTPNAGFVGSDSFTYVVDDGSGNTAETTVNVAVGDNQEPETTRVQIEDFDLTGFILQNVAAAEGQVTALTTNQTSGQATLAIGEGEAVGAGTYSLAFTIFDEADGESVITVSVLRGGEGTPEFIDTIVMDQDGGGNGAQAANIRTETISGVQLGEGDVLVVEGVRDAGELVRIDYVDFIELQVVDPTNQTPIVIGSIPNVALTQGVPFEFDLDSFPPVFIDPDEDQLAYAVSHSYFDVVDGKLVANPTNADVLAFAATGGPEVVVVTATDPSGASASQSFLLTEVANANDAPEILNGGVADQTVTAGVEIAPISIADFFADPDTPFGDEIAFTVDGLPSGVAYDPETGVISGAPTAPGSNTVTVTATDLAGESVEMTFFLEVATPGGPGGDPVRIQAEDFDVLNFVFAENQNAADGAVIRTVRQGAGDATLDITPERGLTEGVNDLAITYFDENDGESTVLVQLLKAGETTPVDLQTVVFNNDGGAGAAQAVNIRTATIPNVDIAYGDQLILTLQADGGEFVRVDYVEFTPQGTTGGGGNFRPIPDPAFEPDGEISLVLGDAFDVSSAFVDPEEDPITLSLTDVNGDPIPGLDIVDGAIVVSAAASGGVYDAILVGVDETGSNQPAQRPLQITVTPTVSIAAPTPSAIQESGDDGTQTSVLFPVTFDIDAGGPVTVEYEVDIDGVAESLTAVIPATGGAIEVLVDNDNVLDAAEAVSVTLTGVAAGSAATATIDPAAAAASATVFEDESDPNLVITTETSAFISDETQTVDFGTLETATTLTGDIDDYQGVPIRNFGLEDEIVATGVETQNGAAPSVVSISGDSTEVGIDTDGDATADLSFVFEGGPFENFSQFVPENFVIGYDDATGELTLNLAVVDDEEPGSPEVLLRINAFGPQVAATDGGLVWTADGGPGGAPNSPYLQVVQDRGDTQGFAGDLGDVPASVPVSVLDTARSSDQPFSYEIPVGDIPSENGQYTVRLYVAELFPGNAAAGDRSFDATLEGVVPATFNDIDAGGNAPGQDLLILEADVTVVDGFLSIGFTQDISDNPIINGIEILSNPSGSTGGPSDEDGPTAAVSVAPISSPNDAVVVTVVFSDATGVDPLDFDETDAIDLVGNGGDAVPAPSVSADAATGTLVFTYAAPAGGWSSTAFTATVKPGAIGDTAFPQNQNAGGESASATVGDGGGVIGPVDPILYGPTGDLDGDTIANASDPDVDGDGAANVDDDFIYDAQNGVLLGDGEMIDLQFDVNGTPWQNGLTGFLQGTVSAGFNEDTGAASVTGGVLNVSPVSNGDTGGNNNPEDDVQLGIKNDTFKVEGRVLNPWFGAAPNADGFDQVGIHIGVDSLDFMKAVFGFAAGSVEFSIRNNNVETKAGGANQPLPNGLTLDDFASVDIEIQVSNGSTATTLMTFNDENGDPIPGATSVSFGSVSISGELAAALSDPTVGVGVGFTQANAGGPGTSFDAQLDSLKITGGAGDPIDPPADPDDAIAILEAATGVDTNGSYGPGAVGAAKLTIMPGTNNVQSSNFGADSFEIENTGDKQIAAVVIDFRNAVFGDSIVDFDGSAGDTTAKAFAVNSDGDTGGYFGSDAETYLFEGDAPLENTTGGGNTPATGGFRGLLIKFDGSDGGFENGEVVGFSGDMDPNSIAGLLKGGTLGVDTGAINGWDVGGVSGAELIGSSFTVLFDDGTTATGYIGSDESQAGSVGEAVQGRPEQTATLTVDTGLGVVASGAAGVYGAPVPTITIDGPPNATVRVVLQKGFQPVTNDAGGTEALVEARLAEDQSEFQVNNAFDVQTFDVTLDGSGSATLPASAFDYNATESGEDFAGSDVQPIAFTAAVIDAAGNPQGPVSQPVYLTNPSGTPVEGGGSGELGDGYFEGIASGADGFRFKVQIEDPNGTGGANPGGKWSYETAADGDGDQAGFQGEGYYLFGSESSTAINGVNENEVLRYRIFVPDSETGTYAFRARVSRDGDQASDQQNDIWLNIIKEDEPGSEIEDFLVLGGDEPEPTSQGYVKVFGGPNNGTWGNATNWDGEPGNPSTQVNLSEGGFYIVEIAGRSQGFHVDYWELAKGGLPATGASNSPFVGGEPPTDTTGPSASISIDAIDSPSDDVVVTVVFSDASGVDTDGFAGVDAVDLEGNGPDSIPTPSVQANAGTNTLVFTYAAPVGGWQSTSFTATVNTNVIGDNADPQNLNPGGESATASVTPEPGAFELQVQVLSDGAIDNDLVDGDELDPAAFGGLIEFSGTLESGSAGSVVLELVRLENGVEGETVASVTENVTPFDLDDIDASLLTPGGYRLKLTGYAATGGTGGVVGVQEIDFTVADDGGTGGEPTAFIATAGPADDQEIGSGAASSDLETDKTIVVRLSVPDGVENVTEVSSALLSFVSDRAQSGSTTLTIGIKENKTLIPFSAFPTTVGETEVDINDPWADDEQIENVVDLADLVNALIETSGPLSSGDYINLVITGEGATRFIVQGTVELDVSVPAAASAQAITAFSPVGEPLDESKFAFDDDLLDASWSGSESLFVQPAGDMNLAMFGSEFGSIGAPNGDAASPPRAVLEFNATDYEEPLLVIGHDWDAM